MVGRQAAVIAHDAAPSIAHLPAEHPGPGRVRILSIFGTRPEAIKMAPVIRALAALPDVDAPVCLTGQHREMLDQVCSLFEIEAHTDLALMRHGQGPGDVTAAVIAGIRPVLERLRPDCVLVHGDTATTLGAALAAFYARIPLGHVEAGLRTGDMSAPWPEEMNRRLTTSLAQLHFAPTAQAAGNLATEGVASTAIEVTGNTAVDALLWVRERTRSRRGADLGMTARFPWLDPSRRLILVTGHRRENIGDGLDGVCAALVRLAARGDVQIAWPLHPNPAVSRPVAAGLARQDAIHLIAPQDYAPFAWLMERAHLILTDSGGMQEEAPALGTPVLVSRTVTERPEAVAAGTAQLVGTDPDRIVAAATALLDDCGAHRAMASATNPYGDGRAAQRIAARLIRTFGEAKLPKAVAQ